jgi:leader peptidase (prepilin peptidase) / N-methyltransferase
VDRHIFDFGRDLFFTKGFGLNWSELPQGFFLWIFFVLGTIWGSFANVIILRLPRGESIVHPRSHCTSCGAWVAWYDNVPLLSWLMLRGRCRKCGARFSFRYFLVEMITGVLFALSFWKFGWSFSFLEMLPFCFALVVVTFIDIDHFLLPDVFTLSGIVIGLVGAVFNPQRTLPDAVLGMLFGGGFLWALAYLYFLLRKEEGMGGGDIKLLAWIGAVLGWQAIPFVIMASSFSGSIVGLLVAYRQKKGMKTMIPFGPYLALAAMVYVFAGESLGQAYVHWLFPSLD